MFRTNKQRFAWVGVLALMVLPAAAIEKPLGYERFTPLTVDSGIFTEKTPKYVFEHYAQPLTLGIVTKGAVTDKRLIDIETHRDKSGNLTLSGVWIENKGDFEQESWLMLDQTYGGLLDFHTLLWKEFIPVDIERYDNKQGNLRYALILQRNIHKAEWLLKLDVTAEVIRYDQEEHRLVDFDAYSKPASSHGQFMLTSYRYDAIMVRNSGPNYAEWVWSELPTDYGATPLFLGYVLTQYQLFGLQATDVEWVNDLYYPLSGQMALFVYSGRDFSVGARLTATEASLTQVFHGRVIDLEGGPEGTEKHWSKWHWDLTRWQTIFCGF